MSAPAPLSPTQWFTLAVVLVTLAGVALGRLPFLPLNRAGIALVGGVALVGGGVLELREAWGLLDGDILTLLFSLMVVNTALTRAGFFRLLTQAVVTRTRNTLGLLVALCFASGVLSAFFLNDTVVLMLTPLVLGVCRDLGLKPVPYLIALAASANMGSVATVTGNPQNLVVAVRGGLGYLEFAAALAPVALGGLVLVVLVVALSDPPEFSRRLPPGPGTVKAVPASPALWRTGGVTLAMLLAFSLGAPVATTALVAAAALLLLSGVPSDHLLAELDWNLLVLFSGLFVTVGALTETNLSALLFGAALPLLDAGTVALSALTALLSNLLSNVPAVLLLAPVIPQLSEPRTAWLTVAMASTLAGNLTLVGSVANLIVVERARREGVTVSFWAYFKLGAPVTLLSLLWGVLWLHATT